MTFKHQFLTNNARNGVKLKKIFYTCSFYSIPIKRAHHASLVQIPFNAKNTSGQNKATLLYVTRNMDHLQQHKTSCRNNVIKHAAADSRLCLQEEICTACNNTRHLQNNSILKMVYHKETSTSSSTWGKVWEALLVAMKNSHQNFQCGWRTGQHQHHSSFPSYPTHKHGRAPFKWSLPSVIQAMMQSIQMNVRMKWQWTNINWGLSLQLDVVESYISLFRYYKDTRFW